jgi:hypothetical protein
MAGRANWQVSIGINALAKLQAFSQSCLSSL